MIAPTAELRGRTGQFTVAEIVTVLALREYGGDLRQMAEENLRHQMMRHITEVLSDHRRYTVELSGMYEEEDWNLYGNHHNEVQFRMRAWVGLYDPWEAKIGEHTPPWESARREIDYLNFYERQKLVLRLSRSSEAHGEETRTFMIDYGLLVRKT